MPRDGVITPRDLLGKVDVLAVECSKCGRSGRYRVATLVRLIGADGKLTDWLCDLTADCPRRRAGNVSDQCDARCPNLSRVAS
jgi:hypothetical protein